MNWLEEHKFTIRTDEQTFLITFNWYIDVKKPTIFKIAIFPNIPFVVDEMFVLVDRKI